MSPREAWANCGEDHGVHLGRRIGVHDSKGCDREGLRGRRGALHESGTRIAF